MGSKIQAFQSTFQVGVARPNLFTVEFPKTPGGLNYNNDEMSLRVQSVTLPGKNITTTPNDNAYGPSYEMANGISYAEDIQVTYILDQDHRAREFFNSWQDVIVNPSSYDLNYYDDYIGTMSIYQLDQNEQIASHVMLHEVYPKSVGPIEYSMGDGNSFLTVTVNMAFRRWEPISVAFFPTEGGQAAAWLGNPNHTVSGMGSRGISNELYKLAGKFGIPMPGGVESALGRIQNIENIIQDPMNYFKRSVAQKVSGKIGGFGGGFGGF